MLIQIMLKQHRIVLRVHIALLEQTLPQVSPVHLEIIVQRTLKYPSQLTQDTLQVGMETYSKNLAHQELSQMKLKCQIVRYALLDMSAPQKPQSCLHCVLKELTSLKMQT